MEKTLLQEIADLRTEIEVLKGRVVMLEAQQHGNCYPPPFNVPNLPYSQWQPPVGPNVYQGTYSISS